MHEEYQQLYRVANNNALDLLAEAKILFGMGRYARAFFLAFGILAKSLRQARRQMEQQCRHTAQK
jgi:hypothetical protein